MKTLCGKTVYDDWHKWPWTMACPQRLCEKCREKAKHHDGELIRTWSDTSNIDHFAEVSNDNE